MLGPEGLGSCALIYSDGGDSSPSSSNTKKEKYSIAKVCLGKAEKEWDKIIWRRSKSGVYVPLTML